MSPNNRSEAVTQLYNAGIEKRYGSVLEGVEIISAFLGDPPDKTTGLPFADISILLEPIQSSNHSIVCRITEFISKISSAEKRVVRVYKYLQDLLVTRLNVTTGTSHFVRYCFLSLYNILYINRIIQTISNRLVSSRVTINRVVYDNPRTNRSREITASENAALRAGARDGCGRRMRSSTTVTQHKGDTDLKRTVATTDCGQSEVVGA